MTNPFSRMNEKFIAAFMQRGKRYLVMQEFTRENNLFKDVNKNYVLVSHYGNPAEAMHHYKVIKDMPLSKMIDLENEIERKALEDMLNINSSWIIYSILDANPAATKRSIDNLQYNIRNYIAANTQWRIGKDQEVMTELEITFGELFVNLKYSGRKIRLPLKELEKI